MVLERTLESPLDCKEIQPVHSKGRAVILPVGDVKLLLSVGSVTDVKR